MLKILNHFLIVFEGIWWFLRRIYCQYENNEAGNNDDIHEIIFNILFIFCLGNWLFPIDLVIIQSCFCLIIGLSISIVYLIRIFTFSQSSLNCKLILRWNTIIIQILIAQNLFILILRSNFDLWWYILLCFQIFSFHFFSHL